MSSVAQVIVLWGETPIQVVRLPPRRRVAISEDGRIRWLEARATTDEAGVTVELARDGARVCASRAAPARLLVPTGESVEVALSTPRAASPYRVSETIEPEPLAVRVAVTSDVSSAMRRLALQARTWATLGLAAALHVAALAIAATVMPRATDPEEVEHVVERDRFDFSARPSPVIPVAEELAEEAAGDAPQVCAQLDGSMVGPSISIRGPQDNPDPHLARDRWPDHPAGLYVLGATSSLPGGDALAPTVPWGRDEALGWDVRSASSVSWGRVGRDFATCFGEPPPGWTCGNELPPIPTLASLGLSGIGDDLAAPERWARKPRARVTAGAIEVAANVPRRIVAAAVGAAVERSRLCYERALADQPALDGRMRALLRSRRGEVSVALEPDGELAKSPALRCCVESAHSIVPDELPIGSAATARYAIDFALPHP